MASAAMIVVARISEAAALEPLFVAMGAPYGDIRALITYSGAALGLVLISGRTAKRELADTLDAIIVALGAFLGMWLFLLGGEFILTANAPVAAFVRPIAVALLAGVLTRLLFVVERRTPSFWLLAAAVGCLMAGAVATVGRQVGYPFTARVESTGVFFASYTLLLAAALLHPSCQSPLSIRQGAVSRFSVSRIVVFGLLTLLGPLIWVVAILPSPFNPESVWELGLPIIVASLVGLLLLWRLAIITQLADNRADMLDALRKELAYRATHDPLTGLGNRAELISHLDVLVGRRGPNGGRSALLLLDIDGFKRINDTFGHPVGDELLVEIGKRLTAVVPPDSTVARLGGDEFAILLADADEQTAVRCAEVVRGTLDQPFVTSSGPLTVSASVGVCLTPRVEMSSSEVLRDADLALYSAKAAGKNQVRIYDKKLENTPHQETR